MGAIKNCFQKFYVSNFQKRNKFSLNRFKFVFGTFKQFAWQKGGVSKEDEYESKCKFSKQGPLGA